MSARKVRFGIIGAGVISAFHAEAIKGVADAQLTAVLDVDYARAREFAAKHDIAAYEDLDVFLATAPIDAVTIATPTGLHGMVAIPAARSGKHIMCEKPLDTTPERSQAIIDACRESNVILAPIFQYRFGAAAVVIKRAIEAGRFGRILFISGRIKWVRTQEYYDSGVWRGTWALDGGGCLMNQSIHTIDLMLHFGGQPDQVFGYTATRTHTGIEVEDNACAVVRFRSGAMGVIESSTSCAPGLPLRIEVSGERGTAAMEGDTIAEWRFADVEPGDDEILASVQGRALGDGASDPKAISAEGHRLQVADLTKAILTASPPAIDAAQAKIPVELICGIYQSMKSGRPYVFEGGK